MKRVNPIWYEFKPTKNRRKVQKKQKIEKGRERERNLHKNVPMCYMLHGCSEAMVDVPFSSALFLLVCFVNNSVTCYVWLSIIADM